MSGGDQSVNSFVPMLFFKNDYVFIDGTEMGAYFYRRWWKVVTETWLSYAFYWYPNRAKRYEGDTADFGAQFTYQLDEQWGVETEIMSDSEYNFHGNLRRKS